jgi:hypothetical protein
MSAPVYYDETEADAEMLDLLEEADAVIGGKGEVLLTCHSDGDDGEGGEWVASYRPTGEIAVQELATGWRAHGVMARAIEVLRVTL